MPSYENSSPAPCTFSCEFACGACRTHKAEKNRKRTVSQAFSQTLQHLRRQRGLSIVDLAKLIPHKKPITIEMLERGMNHPDLPTLLGLADAFSISPAELMMQFSHQLHHQPTP